MVITKGQIYMCYMILSLTNYKKLYNCKFQDKNYLGIANKTLYHSIKSIQNLKTVILYVGDNLGRKFYTKFSEKLLFKKIIELLPKGSSKILL